MCSASSEWKCSYRKYWTPYAVPHDSLICANCLWIVWSFFLFALNIFPHVYIHIYGVMSLYMPCNVWVYLYYHIFKRVLSTMRQHPLWNNPNNKSRKLRHNKKQFARTHFQFTCTINIVSNLQTSHLAWYYSFILYAIFLIFYIAV